MTPRLKEKFYGPMVKKLQECYKIQNSMALPRLEKIVLTVGMGNVLEGTKLNVKAKGQVIKDLSVIAGQKPVMTKARKSVANFKVRRGYENGAMITLRGNRMWEFFDRLVTLAIPRIRDFRGLPEKGFDGQGNYSFGINEQGVFPEVNMAEVEYIHGMNITIVFRKSDDEKSKMLLQELGVPFVIHDAD
jgi:large subunit ribosomal protein L5